MGLPKLTAVNARDIPVEAIEMLRPHAVRAGHSASSDGAVIRFAIVELTRRIKEEEERQASTAPDFRTNAVCAQDTAPRFVPDDPHGFADPTR